MKRLSSPADTSLELKGKLYQRSIYPKALEISKGKRLSSPIVVDLDPTTFCDLSCPECISKNVINQTQFSTERLVAFSNELASSEVKAVILIGGGEPLMHKGIGKTIDILSDAGIKIGLVTNGTLIHRYIDQLSTKLSWIRVSLDAATEETYDVFRPSGRKQSVFPTIISNMRNLASVRSGNLGYSFLLMYRMDDFGRIAVTNYHEVLAAGRLAKDIGCDYLEVKAMFDEHHYVIGTPDELLTLLHDQLEELKELEDANFTVLSSSTCGAIIEKKDRVQEKKYTRCNIGELRTTVTPSGVYLCPYHRGNAAARIGDIKVQDFSELWRTADIGIVNPSRDCQFHCARHESNLAIAAMADTVGHVRILDDYDPFI